MTLPRPQFTLQALLVAAGYEHTQRKVCVMPFGSELFINSSDPSSDPVFFPTASLTKRRST